LGSREGLYEYFTRATYFKTYPRQALRFKNYMPVARWKSMTLRGHRLPKEERARLNAEAQKALRDDPGLSEEKWELEPMMAAISEASHKDRQLWYFTMYRFGSGIAHGDAWLLDKQYQLDAKGKRVVSLASLRSPAANCLAYHTAEVMLRFVNLIGEVHKQDVSDAVAPFATRLAAFAQSPAREETEDGEETT
jgi:hypothetical protein